MLIKEQGTAEDGAAPFFYFVFAFLSLTAPTVKKEWHASSPRSGMNGRGGGSDSAQGPFISDALDL